MQNEKKVGLAILLICFFYIIGNDILTFYISQSHPEFYFYPLSTILLYISLFYISAGSCILVFLLFNFIVFALQNYQHKPFWRSYVYALRNQFLTRPQLYRMIFIFLLVPLFFAFVGMYKQLIPVVNPFSWDHTFMHWDYAVHFHHHPWKILQPLVGYPAITYALSQVYGFWFIMLAGLILWQANTKKSAYRAQFFLTFFISWIILGTVMAYYFSSAGPCFYRVYSLDMHDPYSHLMYYLNQNGPAWVINLQQSLLSQLLSKTLIFGGGVSAMPSMHLSMATLCFLICSKHSKLLGWLSLIYLILIFIGSIHLAWHYAVDDYVAILGTGLIWYCLGKILPNPK